MILVLDAEANSAFTKKKTELSSELINIILRWIDKVSKF